MNSEQNKIVSTQPTGSVVSIGSKQDVELLPMSPAAAKDAVIKEVSCWGGVSVHEHRMGGVEFRLGRRELGHLHGTIADLPFLRHVRDELVAAGHAKPHHVLPDSGWVTVPIRTTSEVANVIELFRRNYERAAKARQQR